MARDVQSALSFANRFAPEHLSIPGGEAALARHCLPRAASSSARGPRSRSAIMPAGPTTCFPRAAARGRAAGFPLGILCAARRCRSFRGRGCGVWRRWWRRWRTPKGWWRTGAPWRCGSEAGTCGARGRSARSGIAAGACAWRVPRARFGARGLAPYVAPEEGRAGKLRLDFNENTVGCSPAVLRALRRIRAEQLAIYPEYEAATRRMARHFGVRPAEMLLTNGVDDALAADDGDVRRAGQHGAGSRADIFDVSLFRRSGRRARRGGALRRGRALSAGGDSAGLEALAARSVPCQSEQSDGHAARSRARCAEFWTRRRARWCWWTKLTSSLRA